MKITVRLPAGHAAVALATILVGLPLLGISLSGGEVTKYLEFPPLTHYVRHPGFSWPVFTVTALVVAAAVSPFLVRAWGAVVDGSGSAGARSRRQYGFPWWGGLGLVCVGLGWTLAWSRLEADWITRVQLYAFPTIWLGFTVVINALTYRRSGACMLLTKPGTFMLLFPLSAAFWWFFEYLNRFVQNWYYLLPYSVGPTEYIVSGSLSFATVLPAVLGMVEWLQTFPLLRDRFGEWRRIRVRHPRVLSAAAFLVGALSLMGIGVWPNALYPMLWLSPVLLVTAWQVLTGRRSVFSPIATGNWLHITSAALAGLICGFFWEMWNYRSLAKWVYAVPYVHHADLKLFEMPIIGFAGYFTFGLECLMIGTMVGLFRRDHTAGARPAQRVQTEQRMPVAAEFAEPGSDRDRSMRHAHTGHRRFWLHWHAVDDGTRPQG